MICPATLKRFGNLIGAVFRATFLVASSIAVVACGNGTSSATPPMPTVATNVNSPSDTPPTIRWIDKTVSDLGKPLSGQVSLDTSTTWTITGTAKVEFFIDGVAVATQTQNNGIKWPGVPIFEYVWSWVTAGYADGPHAVFVRVTDKLDRTADTPTITASVLNQVTFAPQLTLNAYSAPSSKASGSGVFAVNLATGELQGEINLTENVSGAHIHEGFADAFGKEVLTLVRDHSNPNRWILPSGSSLTLSQLEQLRRGALYVDVDSMTHPDGEFRAQLK